MWTNVYLTEHQFRVKIGLSFISPNSTYFQILNKIFLWRKIDNIPVWVRFFCDVASGDFSWKVETNRFCQRWFVMKLVGTSRLKNNRKYIYLCQLSKIFLIWYLPPLANCWWWRSWNEIAQVLDTSRKLWPICPLAPDFLYLWMMVGVHRTPVVDNFPESFKSFVRHSTWNK